MRNVKGVIALLFLLSMHTYLGTCTVTSAARASHCGRSTESVASFERCCSCNIHDVVQYQQALLDAWKET